MVIDVSEVSLWDVDKTGLYQTTTGVPLTNMD